MKFSAVHKLATYLMATSAFLALALSGEIPPLTTAAGGVGMLLSWFWEPPRVRPERWTIWWNVGAVAAFAYTFLSAFGTGDWIVAGSNFLTFLLVAKLFNRRTSRDHQWIYVLTFLMLVAGTTLNAEISYAICFLGYVVFATWALILFHLRREMEDNFLLKHSNDSSSERVEVERILSSRRIVGARFLIATSAVSLGIFIVSAMLFLVFPRVGFGFFFSRGQSRMTFAGFSENVTLGGHGLIRDDPTVVMRVQVSDPRFRGLTAPELHWRGVSFDEYKSGQWRRSDGAFGTRATVQATGERTRVRLDAAHTYGDIQTALRQEIFLEPLETSALFGASTPLAFELGNISPSSTGQLGRLGQNDEVRYGHSAGLRYVAYSDPFMPDRARLAAAQDANPKRFARYLQVAPEITPRVRELALSITRGKTTTYEKTEAVLDYLKAHYKYTLLMEAPGGDEPLDHFLFERKMGHCEYFSTAMAILLRVAGVPTRNVDGFLGGEWNEYGGYIAVRGGDAHAWVEVWFDKIGWVTYDPTPAGGVAALSRGGGDFLDRMRRMLDTIRLQWFKWVMEYDLSRQLNLMRGLAGVFGLSEGGKFSGRALSSWVRAHRAELALAIAGLALAIAIPVAWRRRRSRLGVVGPGPRRALHPIAALYARAARVLARRGYPRPPNQTPREHAAQLLVRGAPGATPFAALTESYYTVVYASAELARGVDLGAARALADQVRSAPQRTR